MKRWGVLGFWVVSTLAALSARAQTSYCIDGHCFYRGSVGAPPTETHYRLSVNFPSAGGAGGWGQPSTMASSDVTITYTPGSPAPSGNGLLAPGSSFTDEGEQHV